MNRVGQSNCDSDLVDLMGIHEYHRLMSLAFVPKNELHCFLGKSIEEEVKLIDLGRRSILSLRQNLIAKIYEHDSNNIFKLMVMEMH